MIEVRIEDPAWTAALPEAARLVERAARAVLPDRKAGDDRGTGQAVSATVILADDATVRDLNARFRGRDRATNVLSFPDTPPPGAPPEAPYLGDIILAYGVCAQEAGDQAKPLSHHLSHLIIHGLLHLMGHDHQDEDEAERMEALERTLLAGLGIDDPYRLIEERQG